MVDSSPRVAVISLGGTIAMTAQTGGGVSPTLSAADLVDAVPGLSDTGVAIDVHDFRRLPSASLGYADVLDLARTVDAMNVDGVVVTQGTDTLEETAFLLELLHRREFPVVLTGAMRNASMAGADGPANLLAAVKVAASPAARGIGCAVVFADEIHAGRWVRKAHATSPTAFTSYPGPIGYVAENDVRLWARPEPRATFEPDRLNRSVRTATAMIGLGDDGAVLNAIGREVDGLVVAAFGAGHVPAACVDVLAGLAERMPVVLGSRTGAGPVLSATYRFDGSEADLLSRNLLPAQSLPPAKARILLQVLLMSGADRAAISESFGGYR